MAQASSEALSCANAHSEHVKDVPIYRLQRYTNSRIRQLNARATTPVVLGNYFVGACTPEDSHAT